MQETRDMANTDLTGQIVTIVPEWCDTTDEANDRYVVLEDNGPRVVIAPVDWDLGDLIPIQTVARETITRASL